MLMRAHIVTILTLIAGTACVAATPPLRDGSTKAKAILLKQRDPSKAVAEEITWMTKLYHYTPLLAMRDAVVDAGRKLRPGEKISNASAGWGHSSEDYNGHLISPWWVMTPRGKKESYFDTGTLVEAPGEVRRQESGRA